MLALFAGESRELAMGSGIISLRVKGAGGRTIVKSAGMLLLEIHSEAVLVILSAILLSLYLDYLHEHQRVSYGNRIISV